MRDELFDRLGSRLYDRSLSDEYLERFVVETIGEVLRERRTDLDPELAQLLVEEICDDVLRHGPIEPLLRDETVTEIMVSGTEPIFVERNGVVVETTVRFSTDDQLRRVIDRIVSRVGRRIDESSPMVDARLPDGSRVNAVIPPLVVDGSALTIRKFAARAFEPADLVRNRTLTAEVGQLLEAGVRGKLNVLVSGGTGAGKTTLLNVLSRFIPARERIVTVEDSVELRLHQRHVIRLEARPANVEGVGEVTIRDLVRNSLRMRPDRIVVGEVRGGEALDMLQAMNTGHEGSMSTLHANSPRDAVARLETMVLMAGLDLPARAVRDQIAAAVDVIVQINRTADGARRITRVTEVVGMEGDVVTLADLFVFDHTLGRLRPTGLRPMFADKLTEHGETLAPQLFFDAGPTELGPMHVGNHR
ncbi:MAG: CpaF family protein [Actinomycetota bacterium]|nr:CpaF family protein [Actinomycetota bacterium]